MKIVPNFTAAFGSILKNSIQQIIPSSSAYKSLEIGTITTTKTILAARSKLRKGVQLDTGVKMPTHVAVIGIVQLYDARILLLKRNAKRRTSPEKWQTPSGFIKEGESAEEAVLREVKEETSLEGTIAKCGNSFEVIDEWSRWIIIPFLISVESDNVVIDSGEHSEFKWIIVDQVTNFECVKGIEDDLRAVGLMN